MTSSTSVDTTDVWVLGLGIAVNDDGTTREMTMTLGSEDGQSTSDTFCKVDSKIANAPNDAGTESEFAGLEATLKSWNSDGFTLDVSRAQSSKRVYYMCMGYPDVGTAALRRRREGY